MKVKESTISYHKACLLIRVNIASLKSNPVKSKNIKNLFCQQSTKESTETSSSTSIDLNSEKIAEGAVQLTSTSVFAQQTSTSVSTQMIRTLLYVPPTVFPYSNDLDIYSSNTVIVFSFTYRKTAQKDN